MRTYVLDILNRYKRYSENLDVKTILCNKSWLVFNDGCDKEVYIFQENGSLILSINGKVYNGSWQYITANKSIIISSQEQSYMLHPYIYDNVVFVLQQDGTDNYAFMIDEIQSKTFLPRTMMDISGYFEEKVRKEENNQDLIRKQEQDDYVEKLRSTAELTWIREVDDILGNDQVYKEVQRVKRKLLLYSLLFSFVISSVFYIYNKNTDTSLIIFIILFSIVYFGTFLFAIKTNRFEFHEKEKKEKFIREYIDEHLLK